MNTRVMERPSDALFVNDVYGGVTVPKVWIMTSKCSGKDCVSKLAADPRRVLLADVMEYQNPDVVARICHDTGCTPEVAEDLFVDLKRFLWLAAQNPTTDMIPTPSIDEAWHAFVLFTQDYADFCENYFGAFVHHTAHRVGEPRAGRPELIPTIDAMNKHFGGVPSQYWHYTPAEALRRAA